MTLPLQLVYDEVKGYEPLIDDDQLLPFFDKEWVPVQILFLFYGVPVKLR